MKIKSKKLAYLLHTLSQLDRWLLISFFIAIALLLNYETFFIRRFWENKFTRGLNIVSVQILYAYVTGFIFYLFIELVPKHKKVIALFRLINNNIHQITELMSYLLNEICLSGKPLPEGYKIYSKEFSDRCGKINIYEQSVETWFYHKNTFRNYVLWTCEQISLNVNQITGHVDLLNDDWINALSHIQDTVRHVERFLEVNRDKSTLSVCSLHLWVLYGEVQILDNLSDEYYKRYYRIHKVKNPPGSYLDKNLFYEVKKRK
jgi:hypothetical protein